MTEQMTPEDYLQLSSVYALLSRLWVKEVDLELLTALNEPDMRAAYKHMGGYLPQATEAVIEELAVDYCQLLVGPKNHVPPIQSIWEDKKFQGNATVSMGRYFEVLPTFDPPTAIVDHIGVQLAFVAELIIQASAAEEREAYDDIATRFYADHFAWTGPFFEQVIQKAETKFYKGLATISADFLAME